jgi:hypothetical protein
VMVSLFPCPATNPTARSLAVDEAVDPEAAAVPVFDVPVAVSTGLVVATPENSWTTKLIEATEAVWAVTVVVAEAPAEYQTSPFELWPDEL